jgi:hypothetical protein
LKSVCTCMYVYMCVSVIVCMCMCGWKEETGERDSERMEMCVHVRMCVHV